MQRAASKTSSIATSAPHASQAPTETSARHATEGSPDPSLPGAGGPGERPSCGMLTLTTNSLNGVNYVDGAHWSALLDSLSELKDCFPETTEPGSQFRVSPPVVPDYGPSPQLLYGRFAQASKAEILGTIPTRPVVDRMISKFFNTMDLAPGSFYPYLSVILVTGPETNAVVTAIIHRGQFIRQVSPSTQHRLIRLLDADIFPVRSILGGSFRGSNYVGWHVVYYDVRCDAT